MIGIKDLAKHLDISIGTVSRALNDRPDVNPETRKKVLAAAASLGYVANQSGRSLRRGTTNAIGFMIESGGDTASNSDDFFLGVMDGLQSTFSRHQLDLVVLPCSTEESPKQYLQRMVARGLVDGMIITATHRIDNRIDLLANSKIPFVCLGRSDSGTNYPWVDLDFEGVARRSIDRLVHKGHRRIAIALPSSDINLGFILLESYKKTLARHRIAFDPDLVLRAQSTEQGGYAIADDLLRLPQQPTGILLVYELMAHGIYRRLREEQIVPGRDLAVIGFRNSVHSRFLTPTLTSFKVSLRDLGIALAEGLLATMPDYARHYPSGKKGRIWPMELVEGESDTFEVKKNRPASQVYL